jgi:hypothetical protein
MRVAQRAIHALEKVGRVERRIVLFQTLLWPVAALVILVVALTAGWALRRWNASHATRSMPAIDEIDSAAQAWTHQATTAAPDTRALEPPRTG